MLLEIFLLLFCSIYFGLCWINNHWKRLNVDCIEPSLLFGNVKDAILLKRSFADVYLELYRKTDKPAVGIYKLWRPQLFLRDPELIKMCLTNEFSNFHDNAYYAQQDDFVIRYHPVFMKGQRWQEHRTLVSQSLTPSKLKTFVPQMLSICQKAIQFLEANQDEVFEVRTLANQYTTDAMVCCIFGIESNTISDPNSKFRLSVIQLGWLGRLLFNFCEFFPKTATFLKLGVSPKSTELFYCNIIEEALRYRKENSVRRNDYLQHLIDLREENGMSVYDMGSYTMMMMADGVDSSGVVVSHFLQILSEYPDVQEKIREEFKRKIQNVEDITYENIQTLSYLNAAFLELLRIRTPVPVLEKMCTKDKVIEFNGHKYKMTKGDVLSFSIQGVHEDPAFFPEPEMYKPERFLENTDNPAYLPFGLGPRTCLGKLLAIVEVKIFIVSLVSCFNIIPTKENAPVVPDEYSMFVSPLKYDYNVYFKKV